MPISLDDWDKQFQTKRLIDTLSTIPVSSDILGSQYTPSSDLTFGEDIGKTFSSVVHGLAKGMTLGQSEKFLKLVFGSEAVKKRQEELAGYKGTEKAIEFAGQLFPITKAIKVAGAMPYLAKLPPVLRATITNALAGAGLGAIEQKAPEESRLGKMGKEAGIFGVISGVAAGATPLAKIITKAEIPVLSRVAGWTVQKELPSDFKNRLREMYGEAGLKRMEAQKIGSELAKFTPTEQRRATQLFKGGISTRLTKPELIEVVEKGKQAFGEATETFQKGGILGKPYYQKLTNEELGALKKKESWMNERLEILKDTQKAVEEYPAKGKSGLFANYNKLLRWKEQYKSRLRELRSLERWKDVDLDKNMAEIAVEGIDEELATVKNIIKTPDVKTLQSKMGDLQTQIKKVTDRINTNYHLGGTGYFPRMYATKEEVNNISKWGFFKPLRFRGKRTYLKPREDLTDEVRKNMGEIVTAPYPVQKRLQQLSRDTALFNLFDDVAKNPEWSTTSVEIAKQKGWVKLTKTPTWGLGNLRKSYIHPDIASELNEISKISSDFERAYEKVLGFWKFGKVVPRLATSARNITTNFMFADLGGVSYSDPKSLQILKEAVSDYIKNGAVRQKLIKVGAIGTEYLPTEANIVANGIRESAGNIFSSGIDLMRKGAGKLGNLYTAQDQIFKQWIYTNALKNGKTEKEALDLVFKWMPNYREVPEATKFIRKSPFGAPFFSFTSEAMRIVGEAAREKPLKLAKWLSVPLVMNEVGKRKLGMSEQEYQTFKKQQPFWKRNGLHVLLPIGNKNKPTTLDLTYTMFYNDAVEYSRDPLRVASNPLLTTAVEAITGRNRLTDKPIITHTKPSVFGVNGIQDWVDHLYTEFAPTLAPEIPGTGIKGGYDYQKIKDLITGKPNRFTGEKPKIGQILGSTVFGLKTETLSKQQLRKSYLLGKKKELDQLRSELARVVLDKSKSSQEKETMKKRIMEKINQIKDEIK